MKIKQTLLLGLIVIFLFLDPQQALAHRSGCHRWHSCPSDRGTYTCGDLGYPCKYPTYPEGGGTTYTTPIIKPSPTPTPKPLPTATPTPTPTPVPTSTLTPTPLPISDVKGVQTESNEGSFWPGLLIIGTLFGLLYYGIKKLKKQPKNEEI